MKKLIGIIIVVGMVTLATAAFAGLPSLNVSKNSTVNSAVNKGVDTAKNKAIADDINKKVAAYNCSFKKNKTTETTCDLNKVYGLIKSKKAPFEALGIASVYVTVRASNYDRAHYAEDFGESALGTYWKISSNTNSTLGDKLEITVKSY